MKTPFLDYWTGRRERGEVLENRDKIKLTTAQLSTLLGDSDVRAALQKSHVASLLPPVGSEVFRRFTKTSMQQIEKFMDSKKKQAEEDDVLKPAPELESEKTLPFFYGVPPPELRNVPLEDPDPFYQSKKTFVVVDRRNTLYRFNAESSCFHFSPFSLFRRAAIKILNHRVFTAFLFVVLLANIILMAPRTSWKIIPELVFLSIYTFEAVLKILSRGFCLGRFTYLRDSWNRLDVVIIATGFAILEIKELWFFRALRIIKILGLFQATRRNAKLFGRVLNRLWDVFLLTLLLLSLFSIIGTNIMMGSLRNKCVMWPPGSINSSDMFTFSDSQNATVEPEPEFNYKAYISDPDHLYFQPGQLDAMVCGNVSDSSKCPEGYTCIRTGTNPNYGYTNFDHFGYSFLATFRLMARDFWENLAHMVMQAEGKSFMTYFVLVWFICVFSLTAFIVAAFIIAFTGQTEREVKEAKRDKKNYEAILAALKDKGEDELPEKKDSEEKVPCCRRMCSWDCCDCWVRLKKGLQVVVLDPFFDLAIIILIILNVIFMSCSYYPMTEEFEEVLAKAGLAFTFIFFLEVIVKILALGPYEFFQVKWHYFDTIIVVLSILELGLADIQGVGEAACYLRLFRLGRWWPGLLKWMRLVWAGLRSVWLVSLVLVTFFFSMFGTLMFSDSYDKNICRIASGCQLPRWHFVHLFHSFMTVTRAVCGEWIETIWDCFEAFNPFVCVVFYITLLIVGNFLVLGFFFTLLMKWISDKLAPKDEEKLKTSRMRFVKMLKVCGINAGEQTKDKAAVDDMDGTALTSVTSEPTAENGTQSSTLPIGEAQNFQKMKEAEEAREDPEDCCPQKCSQCCPSLVESQGCGRVWANLRRAAFNIVQHPYFNNFIFFIVIVSCLALMLEDSFLPSRRTMGVILGYLDQVITYLFVLEVLFKWIGLGFHRYFRDGWCWLELIVTLGCVLSLAAQTSSQNVFLISLKAVRPLRILGLIKGTRRSVGSLLKMVPPLIDVLLVSVTVWLFFALLSVSMFAGKFYYCFNETAEEYFDHKEVANRTECFLLIEQNFTEVRWKNTIFNFDHVAGAYFSLFSVGTMKGWIDILYAMSDSVRVEDQPQYEHFLYSYLFIVLFLLFGCFFCFIHIFKVLFDSYSSQTQKMGGSHLFLTEDQMKDFNNIVFRSKRPLAPCPRPQGKLRGRLFDLVSREAFEWVMQVFIMLGVLVRMIERYDMTMKEEEVFYFIEFSLVLLFLLEFILKISAFRRSYFSDNLNVVDFVVLILQIISMFIYELMYFYFFNPAILHLLRLCRLSRIIHRFPCALRLRLLFSGWTKSLRAIFHLTLVLFVLMFGYASFGTFHFHQLRKAAFITDLMNFETFGNSLLCMFTATTWGGWDGLVLPMLYSPPDCIPAGHAWSGEEWDCANPDLGRAFILTFLCLSSYVIVMMVLVVLVDMLNVFGQMHCDPLSVLNLNHFFKTWRKFAPDSSHFIQRSQLPGLCDKLKEPLRIPKPAELGLELGSEEQVHCRDVLLALSVQALGDCADRKALKARIDEKYHEYLPKSPSQDSCEMTNCTLQMDPEEAATPVTEETEE